MLNKISRAVWTGLIGATFVLLVFSLHAVAQDKPVGTPDETKYVYALMKTSMGDIVLELDSAKAPITCANFLQYAESGYYEGTIFHRVITHFVIQGGGFLSNMTRKEPREAIANEWKNGLKNKRGTIAMARLGGQPNSATSQFFINVKDNDVLDVARDGASYAVFGKVIEGMEVVDRIRQVKVGTVEGFQNVPLDPVTIDKVTRLGSKGLEGLKMKIDDKRKSSVTPLHLAVKSGDFAKVQELLKNKGSINARDTLLQTPLHYAAFLGRLDDAQALVKAGADITAVDANDNTPLQLAAEQGYADIVALMLDNGADVNGVNGKSETALHLATMNGHIPVVDLLLKKKKTEFDLQDGVAGRTPLLNAVEGEFTEIVSLLLNSGVSVDRQDKLGNSPLSVALRKGNEEIVTLLLNSGANVNVKDSNGNTPLHAAALAGNVKPAALIINAGANVNAVNNGGGAPLHFATIKNFLPIVQLLLNQGAEVNIANDKGLTPLSLAVKYHYEEIADLLRTHGGSE